MTDATIFLTDFPEALATFFNTSTFIAGIMCSLVILVITIVPVVIVKRGRNTFYIEMVIGMVDVTLCMAIGWLPLYVGLVVNLLTAIALSAKLRDWLG